MKNLLILIGFLIFIVGCSPDDLVSDNETIFCTSVSSLTLDGMLYNIPSSQGNEDIETDCLIKDNTVHITAVGEDSGNAKFKHINGEDFALLVIRSDVSVSNDVYLSDDYYYGLLELYNADGVKEYFKTINNTQISIETDVFGKTTKCINNGLFINSEGATRVISMTLVCTL